MKILTCLEDFLPARIYLPDEFVKWIIPEIQKDLERIEERLQRTGANFNNPEVRIDIPIETPKGSQKGTLIIFSCGWIIEAEKLTERSFQTIAECSGTTQTEVTRYFGAVLENKELDEDLFNLLEEFLTEEEKQECKEIYFRSMEKYLKN